MHATRSAACGGSILEQYSVKLLPAAYDDIDEIYGYIALHLQEPSTAQKLVQTLENAIFSLETLPCRGACRKTGAYANAHYRQLFVNNFTIVYRVEEEPKQVIIVTVRYAKRQF